MGWDSKSLKEAFSDITEGPKASRLGCALGEISVNDDSKSYERLCPHCYDIVEVDRDSSIWGCLSCTRSFVATDNIDNNRRVGITILSLFGLSAKTAIREGRVANIELKKIRNKIEELCSDNLEKQYQKKMEKSAKNDKFSLDYFAEILYSSFEGKLYRDYREVLYRTLFALISSDGKIYSYETGILKDVEKIMKFNYPIYDYLYSELINSVTPRYAHYILGTTNQSSKEEIEKAYKEKRALFDEVASKDDELNFPNILKEFSKKHTESIDKAYNIVINSL